MDRWHIPKRAPRPLTDCTTALPVRGQPVAKKLPAQNGFIHGWPRGRGRGERHLLGTASEWMRVTLHRRKERYGAKALDLST